MAAQGESASTSTTPLHSAVLRLPSLQVCACSPRLVYASSFALHSTFDLCAEIPALTMPDTAHALSERCRSPVPRCQQKGLQSTAALATPSLADDHTQESTRAKSAAPARSLVSGESRPPVVTQMEGRWTSGASRFSWSRTIRQPRPARGQSSVLWRTAPSSRLSTRGARHLRADDPGGSPSLHGSPRDEAIELVRKELPIAEGVRRRAADHLTART